MKRIKQIAVYSFCTLLVTFTSCVGETKEPIKKQYVNKVVVGKTIEQQLPSKWQDSHTYYLIAFSDGDYTGTDYGTYAVTKIGDTLSVCSNCD